MDGDSSCPWGSSDDVTGGGETDRFLTQWGTVLDIWKGSEVAQEGETDPSRVMDIRLTSAKQSQTI